MNVSASAMFVLPAMAPMRRPLSSLGEFSPDPARTRSDSSKTA